MTSPSAPDPLDAIRRLPLWQGPITIEPLQGGITNRNYTVTDAGRRTVVRLGGDIPVHGIMRFNEHAASRAAAAAGISPPVLHAEPGILVIGHIDGRSFGPEDVRAERARCVALMARVHREVAAHLRGPVLSFNVFHILRDYGHTLTEGQSRHLPALPRLLAIGEALEKGAGRIELVFGHNDLLAGNFIDDGQRLWLVDWDYAGFNTPLFDLGGLSSNNGFSPEDDTAMLEAYYQVSATDDLRRRFQAMLAASLLRETLWSMVSELHSTLDFDYAAYTAENLKRFEAAHALFQEMTRS